MSIVLGIKGDIVGNMSDCNIYLVELQIGIYFLEVMVRGLKIVIVV